MRIKLIDRSPNEKWMIYEKSGFLFTSCHCMKYDFYTVEKDSNDFDLQVTQLIEGGRVSYRWNDDGIYVPWD